MRLWPARKRSDEERDSSYPVPFQQYLEMFKYGNVFYPTLPTQTLSGNRESVRPDYMGLISTAYLANPIVFACVKARRDHFSQVRFQYQQMSGGQPGKLFGTADLGILERPWPGGSTGDLLGRMMLDVDLSGNAYVVRSGNQLARLRPDWVNILLGSKTDREYWLPGDPDTEVLGYVYKPGGDYGQAPEIILRKEEVAHFAPDPDPGACYRGTSWINALVREIQADQAMTAHRQKFMEQGATVNLVVKTPLTADTIDKFNEWVKVLEQNHDGLANAYKTMYLGGGADVVPIGADLQQVDFKAVQAAGEVRIAVAARVPATILGISEGLAGSSLNVGNYGQARRNFADGLIRPSWEKAAAALETLVAPQPGARLWYDDRFTAFLKEDLKDTAEVLQMQAAATKSWIDAGFKPDAIIDAIHANDISRLSGQHTGLTSVQLLPPGTNGSSNGKEPLKALTGGTK